MKTTEAFRELICENRAIVLSKIIGVSDSRLRQLRSDIKNKGVFPPIPVMETYLTKAGWRVVQEKLWSFD